MALPTLIEELLSLSKNPDTDFPGSLIYRVGVEYWWPYIPPYTTSSFISTITGGVGARGFAAGAVPLGLPEAVIFFKATFGAIEPGAFQLRARVAGNLAMDGRLDTHGIEQGIDFLFFMTRDGSLDAEITNLTNKAQYFCMYSHYLVCPTKESWQVVRDYMSKRQLSVSLPLPGGST